MIPVAALLAWIDKDTTAALSAALERWFVGWRLLFLPGSRLERQAQEHQKQVMLNMYRECSVSLQL